MPGVLPKHVIFGGIGEGGVDTLLDNFHFWGVQKRGPKIEANFFKKRSKNGVFFTMPIYRILLPKLLEKKGQNLVCGFWQKPGPFLDPSKKSEKMTYAKPIFQIWPKSRILTTFFKKHDFPKKGVIFRQNVDFPCALKVVKSGQKGVKKGSFWHFLRTLEIPDIFDKTQARL